MKNAGRNWDRWINRTAGRGHTWETNVFRKRTNAAKVTEKAEIPEKAPEIPGRGICGKHP